MLVLMLRLLLLLQILMLMLMVQIAGLIMFEVIVREDPKARFLYEGREAFKCKNSHYK